MMPLAMPVSLTPMPALPLMVMLTVPLAAVPVLVFPLVPKTAIAMPDGMVSLGASPRDRAFRCRIATPVLRSAPGTPSRSTCRPTFPRSWPTASASRRCCATCSPTPPGTRRNRLPSAWRPRARARTSRSRTRAGVCRRRCSGGCSPGTPRSPGTGLDGRAVALTATEYEILRILSVDAGRVVTSEPLLRQAGDGGREPTDTERVRAFVKQLRAKLGDDASDPAYIFNERGVGYWMPRPGDL